MTNKTKEAERARKDAIEAHATYGSANGPTLEQRFESLRAALHRDYADEVVDYDDGGEITAGELTPDKAFALMKDRRSFYSPVLTERVRAVEAAETNLRLHKEGKLDAWGREVPA